MQDRAPMTARAEDAGRLARFDAAVRALIAWLAATRWRAASALILLCLALYLPGFVDMPVTDRDEGRFVQATTQMLETGDFIDIRFQDEPRYQKPVGIYWLQSISASVFGDLDQREIWTYRVPSLLGAIVAVLALWWAARPLFGREVALIAAALLAAVVTMNLEARIAKSDGALIAAIALMQGALMRIYLVRQPLSQAVGLAALFWISLAVGILIKGPIAPAVAAVTIVALIFFGGARDWLRRLHAPWGIPLLLTVTLPWFIAIGVISEGQFYALSLGKDFGAKLQSGQETHWGPPGYYFILFWWTFWPAALVATGGAAIWLWRNRTLRRAAFLLAWIIPYWLVIEAVPTKLPHYALPIYPAVALAAAWVLHTQTAHGIVPIRTYKQAALLWLVIGVLQVAVFAGALWLFETPPSLLAVLLAAVFAVTAPLTALAMRRRAFHAGLALALISAITAYAGIIGEVLPRLTPLWNSERIAELRTMLKPCYGGPAALAGYSEPSAVFHLGTETPLLAGEGAGRWLGEQGGRLAFVTQDEHAEFERGLAQSGAKVSGPIACFTGFNMNGGDVLRFRLYGSGEPTESCPIPEEYRCAQRPDPRWVRLLK
ncbi:ArnT family glycosyltransferase [Dichotomicrobium thermohalophilum]|uniref:4-amino-4-deoxy-L-arabinose transferase-like glycosyltransferase n=1 Tax=Dichotomicrobium thermohalophilum TaxID=933063 RepID=A0A397Q1F8_9HYPH|nr:glycosyltransferase family 39 protein [Dichotomicrobium thermohalophilum]RIA55340.1 4-amino-4-deoxy-L-arabinose transferase-like glycosyltransferase [Dichotomicrobium thermohalophilum]